MSQNQIMRLNAAMKDVRDALASGDGDDLVMALASLRLEVVYAENAFKCRPAYAL